MPADLEPRYSLTELADLAGVTPRTVRYYINQGLLTADVTSGPGPKYHDAHLARLRLIRRLQREHQPLAEIRGQLATLDDDAILAVSETQAAPPPLDSALDYIQRARPRMLVRGIPASRPLLMSAAPTEPAAPVPDVAPATRLERSQWERIDLVPDVELHLRRPLSRATAKQVDRLISIARDLFREEPK